MTSGIKCPIILRDKTPIKYLKKTDSLSELASLAKNKRLFIYSIAIKPKIGPARNEITKINNKLKFSEDTLIIFVSPHIPVETA